jgi:mRNA-degrading endonuclease RelE of RelBE toxin-antitoxin system
MPEVLLHPAVDDWLDDAPADVERQVRKKLRDAGARPGFLLEPLRGRDTFKLAAGDYRAEIDWDEESGELRVLQVGHRDKFYE